VSNVDERNKAYWEKCAKAAEERLRVQQSKAPIAWDQMSNEEIVALIGRADRVIEERLCPVCKKPLHCWLNTMKCQRCGRVVCINAECSLPISGEVNGTGQVQHYCPECHAMEMVKIEARKAAQEEES
jgi:late competence protein required for DNA uptake (superfamily II DNA/RNA helicase)